MKNRMNRMSNKSDDVKMQKRTPRQRSHFRRNERARTNVLCACTIEISTISFTTTLPLVDRSIYNYTPEGYPSPSDSGHT